jgi:hypothetical protein
MARSDQFVGISRSRSLLLLVLFFCMCLGLGYQSLNRVDWRTAPGLTDVQWYAAMVSGHPIPVPDDHRQFRILVPYLARPLFLAAKGHVGSWDPAMLGLLVVDSLFVAGTATLLMQVVMESVGNYSAALGSALIYLLNFAVPNLRLAGFIDAGEGFFLMAVTWCLFRRRYWMLPLLVILGAMAKELFVPFLIVFSATWWWCERRRMASPLSAAGWIAASWAAAVITLHVVQLKVGHVDQSVIGFGLSLRGNEPYVTHFLHFFVDRNLWYTFFWLAPLSVFRLRSLPLVWRMATAAAVIAAFVLDVYYSGLSGTIARTMFSVCGTLLSASVAILVFENPRLAGEPSMRPAGAGSKV